MAHQGKTLLAEAKLTAFKFDIPPQQPIDWLSIKSLPGLELWKGIALTCGIDPTNPETRDPIGAVAASGPTIFQGFQSRLDTAIEHVRYPGGVIEVVMPNPDSRLHLTIVTLQSIYNLAQLSKWPTPKEFVFESRRTAVLEQPELFKALPVKMRESSKTITEVYRELVNELGRRPLETEVWDKLSGRYPFAALGTNEKLTWHTGRKKAYLSQRSLKDWLKKYTLP